MRWEAEPACFVCWAGVRAKGGGLDGGRASCPDLEPINEMPPVCLSAAGAAKARVGSTGVVVDRPRRPEQPRLPLCTPRPRALLVDTIILISSVHSERSEVRTNRRSWPSEVERRMLIQG